MFLGREFLVAALLLAGTARAHACAGLLDPRPDANAIVASLLKMQGDARGINELANGMRATQLRTLRELFWHELEPILAENLETPHLLTAHYVGTRLNAGASNLPADQPLSGVLSALDEIFRRTTSGPADAMVLASLPGPGPEVSRFIDFVAGSGPTGDPARPWEPRYQDLRKLWFQYAPLAGTFRRPGRVVSLGDGTGRVGLSLRMINEVPRLHLFAASDSENQMLTGINGHWRELTRPAKIDNFDLEPRRQILPDADLYYVSGHLRHAHPEAVVAALAERAPVNKGALVVIPADLGRVAEFTPPEWLKLVDTLYADDVPDQPTFSVYEIDAGV